MLLWVALLFLVPCAGKTVWLFLRAWPNPVFEGEPLTLQCQGWKNMLLSHVTFYKDGDILLLSQNNEPLLVGMATASSSGQYSCSAEMRLIQWMGRKVSETTTVQVQELFPPPVLSAAPSADPHEGGPLTLRCQTKLHPRRSALWLLFSFHKDGGTVLDRSPSPELHVPAARERDTGLYWCEAAPEDGRVQKQSPRLEVRVWAPVSRPLLSLRPGPPGLTVGDEVELLCEARGGSPPVLYSFFLNGETLGQRQAPHGGAASLPVLLASEEDAGNYTCEAENRVSRERSQTETLSLDGPQVSPSPSSSTWLVPWLPASLLGGMVAAAALLGCFRCWRRTAHYQDEDGDNALFSVVYMTPKKREAGPAVPTSGDTDAPVTYTEVKRSQRRAAPATGWNTRRSSAREGDGVPTAPCHPQPPGLPRNQRHPSPCCGSPSSRAQQLVRPQPLGRRGAADIQPPPRTGRRAC